ncbi:hypothetical protein BT96DRAFT_975219 [Gymnopus androsaceus JB14]|uniref:Uncharacterized protein n=1 Tax=Gymnopus androsaceus JB14 TaxID=1447944 RepID=A0A6A4HQH2_9AGAR|nr:hypothetical protein BT96DRAFT_975219 [Gymnopus androsaceus JB14]
MGDQLKDTDLLRNRSGPYMIVTFDPAFLHPLPALPTAPTDAIPAASSQVAELSEQFQKLMSTDPDVGTKIVQALQNAEKAQQDAEVAHQNAEVAHQNAEAARRDAEVSHQNTETARRDAEEAHRRADKNITEAHRDGERVEQDLRNELEMVRDGLEDAQGWIVQRDPKYMDWIRIRHLT